MKLQLPKIFHSKLFLIVLLIGLVLIFILELQQWRKRSAIDKEIDQLVAQEQELRQKNQDLEQSLQYFASDGYKEKLAREQLGMQKPGEIAIQFPQNISNQTTATTTPVQSHNIQKWWHYLFLKNTN